MVDLDMRKRCVKLHIDVALPGRELEGRHGGGDGLGGALDDAGRCSGVESKGLEGFRRQTWASRRAPRPVTKQCTWELSGTAGLLVHVLEREAAEL